MRQKARWYQGQLSRDTVENISFRIGWRVAEGVSNLGPELVELAEGNHALDHLLSNRFG